MKQPKQIKFKETFVIWKFYNLIIVWCSNQNIAKQIKEAVQSDKYFTDFLDRIIGRFEGDIYEIP